MVALLVTTKNEISKLDYDPPHYEVIREAVGGSFEHVRPLLLKRPYCMMVNESGLLNDLPVNSLGSFFCGFPILGSVLFLKEGYYEGEPDVVGMTEVEALYLIDGFMEATGGKLHWLPVRVEG